MERVVSVSGGKDSTACYLLALERGKPFRAVFADTGHEAQKTYDYLAELPRKSGGPPIQTVKADFAERLRARRETLPDLWGAKGIPAAKIEEAIEHLHPTGNPFVDATLYNGIFPAAQQRYCTRQLKIEPIQQQCYRPLLAAGKHVVAWQGIRADESLARSHMQARQWANTPDGRIHIWRPLMRWSLEDVMRYVGKHGLKVNPLYGEGFTRVGCFPCIYSQKAEIALLARTYPEAIDRLERWEALVDSISHSGRATSFFQPKKDPTYSPGETTGIRRISDWAQTRRGGRERELFPAQSKEMQHMAESCMESGVCE